jgi:hypothetical protein
LAPPNDLSKRTIQVEVMLSSKLLLQIGQFHKSGFVVVASKAPNVFSNQREISTDFPKELLVSMLEFLGPKKVPIRVV